MRIIRKVGKEELAFVYLAETKKGKHVEFVESIQPPRVREEKWVLIVSTLYGCPVNCTICDAGDFYGGKLSKTEIFEQIDFMISNRFSNAIINTKILKIQFARMGEPTFNSAVLDVLEELKSKYEVPVILPCISTIAPKGSENFLIKLIEVKNKLYSTGNFQLQFSIHTTNRELRDSLIPINKLDFNQIAEIGKQYFSEGDRKITLNFAVSKNYPIDPSVLIRYFSPTIFLIKLTPVNPSINALKNNLTSDLSSTSLKTEQLINKLQNYGYQVLLSIGELEENEIGSNCGLYVKKFLDSNPQEQQSYKYVNFN